MKKKKSKPTTNQHKQPIPPKIRKITTAKRGKNNPKPLQKITPKDCPLAKWSFFMQGLSAG